MNRIIPIKDIKDKLPAERARRDIDYKAAMRRKDDSKNNTDMRPIEITGKAVLLGLADMQLLITLQTIEQAKIELNKLEKIFKEIENHENKNNRNFDFRSLDFLR